MRLRPGINVVAILALVVTIMLTGCSKAVSPTAATQTTKSTTSATPTSTQTGPYGELTVAVATFNVERFHPTVGNSANNFLLLSPLTDFMIRLNGPNLAPGIIEKWELAPDGLSWTYYVRKGIKFSNGDGLTSADLKFSIETYMSKGAMYQDMALAVDHVDLVDTYTVRIFTRGTQPFLPYLSTMFNPGLSMVFPMNYIKQNGIGYYEQHPIGAGPWKVVQHVPGDMVRFEAVNNHWRQSPDFKYLNMLLVPEMNTRLAGLRTGFIDLTDAPIERTLELEAAGFKTARLMGAMPGVYLFGTYDSRAKGKPTADIRVRQALSLAINRAEIIKTFFYGMAEPSGPPYISLASGDVDYAYWLSYAKNLYFYDPVKASQLLKDAGYANGFSLKLFSYAMDSGPYIPDLNQIVAGYWAKVGVKAEIVPMDQGAFVPLRKGGPGGGPADILVGQASTTSGSDNPVTPRALRTGFSSVGTNSLLGKAMPELDKLIDDAYAEMSPARRTQMLTQIIKTTAETYALIPIAYVPTFAVLGPRVDISYNQPSHTLTFGFDIAKHRAQ